jgi:hypothetical protein
MTVQATVGSTVLAAAVGLGTAGGGTSAPVLVAQTTQTLAFTGASHISLMVTMALLMIVGGVLMNGLSRRHSLSSSGALAQNGPPLTP